MGGENIRLGVHKTRKHRKSHRPRAKPSGLRFSGLALEIFICEIKRSIVRERTAESLRQIGVR